MELAKHGIELWNRGDMDALRERYHSEAVMHHPHGWPEPGPSVGREAIFDQFRRLREDAETDELEMTVVADPGDWVVWEYRWSAVGLESGPRSRGSAGLVPRSDHRCSDIRRRAEMLVDELHGHRALPHCGRAALGRA